MRSSRILLSAALALATAAACATRTTVKPTVASRSFDPTCADGVAVYDSFEQVPYDYYEVAFITTDQNSLYTDKNAAIKAMRNKAAEQGGNGLVINSVKATKSTVKLIGAALGASDADRVGKAVAIYMPADSMRVKNACGKA